LRHARLPLIKVGMQAVSRWKQKATWYYLFIAVWLVALALLWSSRLAETRAKLEPEASVASVLDHLVVEEVRIDMIFDGGSLIIKLLDAVHTVDLTTTPGTASEPRRVRGCAVNGVAIPDFEESWPDYRSRLITRLRGQLDRPDAVAPRGLADVLKLLQDEATVKPAAA